MKAGGEGLNPEPITKFYSEYGVGGEAQLVPNQDNDGMWVEFTDILKIPE
jgi:hypothetical protein